MKTPGETSFAAGLPVLAGIAARHLGWSPPVFWAATPPELALTLTDPAAPRANLLARADLERMMEHDADG